MTGEDDSIAVVTGTKGLVAFWTFGEEAGKARQSVGSDAAYPLQEVGGPIARVEGGPFNGYAAELNAKQYIKIPYADTGTRQYAMLMNMPTYGGPNRLVPHISSEGGVTRRADGSAFPWCCDYASSASPVPTETWCTLGFTYDSKYVRAYINGKLDAQELDPKKHRRTDPYFTHEGPDGGDRGMNPYYHGRGIFKYDPEKHAETKIGGADFTVGARYAVGSFLREATIGKFGGVAVFDRALTNKEMKALHDAAKIEDLN
ncbi:MAG: LamG domain-containing protein [bacterium]|nr:LamG domain-containing protein [bacterium]